jgi:Carbamoyltransferase C-terminus
MPFASVIGEADAAELFDIGKLNRHAARFMTIACGVHNEWRERIPAVVHVDGSARPQIIRRTETLSISTSSPRSRRAPGCRHWSTPASMFTRSRSSIAPRNAARHCKTAGSILS